MNKKIVVSGSRPTGALHLGNYFGAVKNWVELQNSGLYDNCYFLVADWHALTTDYETPQNIAANTERMVSDWLTCGLDPAKSVIFRQSDVPEHAELALMLSMITPLGWLERNPTYKEQLRELSTREIQTHGFLGYPVLQAADILLYKGTHVPVGEDQLPHLELSREIARRFNSLYKQATFPEPQAILTPTPKVLGPDNRKMSKSYGNTISITEPSASLAKTVMTMYTDPEKLRATDKGHPEGCVVFANHKIFSSYWKERERECREGLIGCVACKKDLINQMDKPMALFREKAKSFESKGGSQVSEILKEGAHRASETARATLVQAKIAMGFVNPG